MQRSKSNGFLKQVKAKSKQPSEKPVRRQRKRVNSGISAHDLNIFTKAIGFKSSAGGTHNYIRELLNYLIKTRSVYKASTCLRGSQFLQYHIRNGDRVDTDGILEQVMERLVSICNDSYGNYVVQCFFMVRNRSFEMRIIEGMVRSICQIAINQYGCRVLQEAILSINDELLLTVIDALAPNTYRLAVNNSGCYVILGLIKRTGKCAVKVLLENAILGCPNRLIELSKSSFGCRIVVRMIEEGFPDDQETIVRAIIQSPRYLLLLAMDEFGNYVIQHVVKHFGELYSNQIMDALDGRVLEMAKNKFCSNVIEILYERGGRKVEDRIIKKVDINFIKECLDNRFANYLIQKMLAEGSLENRLRIRRLLQIIPDLTNLKFGKFVMYRLSRLNRY